MEKVAKGGSKQKRASKTTGEFKDTARQLMNVEGAIEELNREAVRHEHRGLVARQGARDLLEEGKKKEARTLIEQMLSERNYVVACGVTSRRIKRLSEEIKETAKRSGGITKRVAKAIGDVELSIKGSVLAEIEEALNSLEAALNPQLERASSVIELVSTVKAIDIDQLQRELEGEISVLSNLSLGKSMSNSGGSRFNTRKYKLEKKLDRGDTTPEVRNIKTDSETEEDTQRTAVEEEDEEDDDDEEEAEDEEDEEGEEDSDESEDNARDRSDSESQSETD
ncbi:uncharacterized protein LOC106672495 [Cimex lectularius]|uniref:Uncharacterized protein n=1 Tax=Cimex lectularius TaxID=79782 RepID=A0A8I6S6A9_CIMLE|nr:uncharacterized protein LOC106672495 [Cimex lectularius]